MEKAANDELTMYSLYTYVYKCTCKYCKHIVNKYLDCDFMLVYFCVNISTYLAFVTEHIKLKYKMFVFGI